MAKKKIDHFLFLEFINFPIYGKKILDLNNEKTVLPYRDYFSGKRNFDNIEEYYYLQEHEKSELVDFESMDLESMDEETHKKVIEEISKKFNDKMRRKYDLRYKEFGPIVKSCIEHLLKNFENKFSKDQIDHLKAVLFTTDFNDYHTIDYEDEEYPYEYRDYYPEKYRYEHAYDYPYVYRLDLISDISSYWDRLRELIRILFDADVLQKSKPVNRLSVFHEENPFFPGVEQVLYRNDAGEFGIELEPIEGHLDEDNEVSEVVRVIGADFANFLLKHYKPGRLVYCKLEGCEQIIIAANGRKYCCEYHRQKAYLKKRGRNKDRYEYEKIRNTLYKQYKARTYLQKKWSLEEYIRKSWPEDNLHLYDRFARAAK